jgi:hypothetical protein
VGYLLGYLGVATVARLRLGSADGAQLSLDSLPYAAAALVAALLVAVAGQRRALREPVVELLRGVPRRRGAWRSLVVEAVLVALAAVATIQLRTASSGLSGVGLLVPGLVVVAVALVAARGFVPATGIVAREAPAPRAARGRPVGRPARPPARQPAAVRACWRSRSACCRSWPPVRTSPRTPATTGRWS